MSALPSKAAQLSARSEGPRRAGKIWQGRRPPAIARQATCDHRPSCPSPCACAAGRCAALPWSGWLGYAAQCLRAALLKEVVMHRIGITLSAILLIPVIFAGAAVFLGWPAQDKLLYLSIGWVIGWLFCYLAARGVFFIIGRWLR